MDELPTEIEGYLESIERCLSASTVGASAHTTRTPIHSPHQFWEYTKSKSIPSHAQTELPHHDLTSFHRTLELHHSRLETYSAHCTALQEHLTSADNVLSDLESQHELVSNNTNSLHETCKKLLAEQTAFDAVVSEIEAPLSYLQDADRLSCLFGVTLNGANTATNVHPDTQAFRDALARVDECIDYIDNNVRNFMILSLNFESFSLISYDVKSCDSIHAMSSLFLLYTISRDSCQTIHLLNPSSNGNSINVVLCYAAL